MTKKESLLANALKERILVLDGAMGTMIQKYELEESDFRGDLFSKHRNNLKGNNDILCLTKPELIASIHEKYLESGHYFWNTGIFVWSADLILELIEKHHPNNAKQLKKLSTLSKQDTQGIKKCFEKIKVYF